MRHATAVTGRIAAHADGPGRSPRRMSLLALAVVAIALGACVGGCANNRRADNLSGMGNKRAILAMQETPSEIQSLVMTFADKYSSRTGDVFDRIYDEAQSPEERVYARRSKVATGFGTMTIAAEINPVIAMLDMVTLVRLKRRTFEDHAAPALSPEHARWVQEMHNQSEREVWELAGRFLTEEQLTQGRSIIDEWYAANPELRTASLIRLQDFAHYRRETPSGTSTSPRNVLSFLYIDPLASLDPVAREVQQSRMFAERVAFFAKRLPLLASWQVQLITADFFATPELRDILNTTETLGASGERFATSTERFTAACERVAATFERMLQDVDRIVTDAMADAHKVITTERSMAIEQSAAVIDAQREALKRDVQDLESGLRGAIADVNKTLAETQVAAAAISASARDTVESAHLSTRDVVDQVYRRLLTLLVVALIGVPAAMIVYRMASRLLFGARAGHPALSTARAADRIEGRE